MVLVIVESPNKVKTIQQYVPKDYVVEASVGHITKVSDVGLYNLGIDVKGNFDIAFEVDDKKKDVVKHLKEQVKRADKVLIMSDPDREGESIAYHLIHTLDIPKKKIERCTVTEITKSAIEYALAHPRKLDNDLVEAALSRVALDKIVGYRLSPISRRKISARSVGRCQSAALKLVVDREDEITNFDSKKYYEIFLPFIKNNFEYKAQYKGLVKNKKNTPTINSLAEAEKIINDCKGKEYIVSSILSKDRIVEPKPPFITSTFQQEASSKLGYSVKRATQLSQQLFEGISIGGKHISLITYIRTDSFHMDPDFENNLNDFIVEKYGEDNLGPKRKQKKSKNSQEAHECLRVIDLNMTPEKLSSYINDQAMVKVYELIYNRTVASHMANAVITDTDYTATNSGYKFIYTEHNIKFPGFRTVYALDDEEITNRVGLKEKEKLNAKDLDLQEKSTKPPARYTEPKLVAELERRGIGRPSTYSTIISTILDPSRGYCEESGKSIAPTEKGISLSHFLDEAFPDIINYDYSAQMEESLDLIAKGKLNRVEFLKDFYAKLELAIKNSRSVAGEKPKLEEVGRDCPECGKPLVYRNGKFGRFIGCSAYPTCKHIEKA